MSEREPGSDQPERTEAPGSADSTSAEGAGAQPQDPDEIRREIEQTREELAETVEAVAAKADVKARAQQEVDERKQQLREKGDEAKARVNEARERVANVTPEQAQQAFAGAQRQASENPLPVVAAGAFLAGLVIGRLTARR